MATNINIATSVGNSAASFLNDGINTTSTSQGAGDPTRPFYSPDVITPEQYFAGPVDFYRQTLGTGISVTDPTEEEEEREDTSPNIFEPIGGGGDDYQSALSYTLSSTGQSGQMPSYDVTNYGVADVNSDVINSISGGKDLSKSWEQGFFDKLGDMVSVAGNVFEQQANKLKDASLTEILSGVSTTGPFGTRPRSTMVPGAVAAMPGVSSFAGLAAGFGALNMAQQAQNAAAFKATSAGALMDVNGMMVSRAPGSLNYVGNLGNYSSKQIAGLEAISKGFVPGTLKAEVYDQTKKAWSYATGTKSMLDSDTMKSIGGTYDPTTGKFVDAFGQTSAMGTEKAAKATVGAFNSKYGSELGWETVSQVRSQVQTDFFGKVKPGTPTFEDLMNEAAIQDSMQRTGLTRGQLERIKGNKEDRIAGDFIVSGRPGTAGLNSKGYSTFSDFRGSSEEADDAPDAGPTAGTPSAASPSATDYGAMSPEDVAASYSDNNNDRNNDGPSDSSSNSDVSSDQQADEDAGVDWAAGGRIGYAPGGEAGFAQRPEFVGGNQTQPDGVSVADDQPRDVQEGTFVINAAAADFAGRDDIEKMIRDAYKKVGDTGQSGVTQEVAINVSKGEVMIPPHIAKVIGYDRLNKINNRGKKEIARRQEAAGGGFIDRKKFADGGGVDNLYTGPLPQPIGSDIVDERIRQFGPTGYGLLDEDQIRLEEQTRINPSAPPMSSEADKQAYRKGVEFGDTEVGFGMLGKTNYNKVLLAGLRDTRTLSDFVKTLGIDEDISGYFKSKPAGVFRSTSNRVLVKNPEFFAQSSGKGMSLSYGAVLAHELMHKGADGLANDPNFKPSETLVKAQRAWKANEESRKDEIGGNTPEHRYIQSVINEAYMLRDVDSVLGKLQRQEKTGEPVRDLELYYDENNNPKFETIFRQVNKSDIAQAKTKGILREMRRSYNSYLTDENKKQFLEENKEYVYDKYGTISMKDSDVPFTTAAGIFRSLNRIMAQDYATKLFESAIANKPIEVQRKPDRKPEPQLAPEPKYERGFLEKALGISPAY